MQETIRERIRGAFAEVCKLDKAELQDDVLVQQELGIDSLLGLQLLAKCEQLLGVEINEDGCADLDTVGEFLDYFLEAANS